MAEIKRTQAPITNPELTRAMDAMKQERNQRTEIAFINSMKDGRFLVPANINKVQQAQANADGTVELKEQPQIQFLLFNNKDGQKFFPLFTDAAEYEKWSDRSKYQRAAIGFRDLCQFFENNPNGEVTGVVVNPYGQNVLVPVESLLRMMHTEAMAPGTKIQIGTLKEEPTELVDVLKTYFAEHEEINRAFLRVMKREDKKNPNFLLVIDAALQEDAALRTLFDGIAAAAKSHLRGVELAIVPASNSFGTAAMKDAEPFYEK